MGYTNGEVGQAFVFDGNEQLVSVGNAPGLQLQNFTIEAWIQRNSPVLLNVFGRSGIIFTYGANGYGFYLDNNGIPALKPNRG